MKYKVRWNSPGTGGTEREVEAQSWNVRDGFLEFYNGGGQSARTTVWAVREEFVLSIEALKPA
jgi:hypothetical protein